MTADKKPFLTGPFPSCLGNVWIGGRGTLSDVILHSEEQYENHDSKVTVNHFSTRPLMSFDYFWAAELCATEMISVERGT